MSILKKKNRKKKRGRGAEEVLKCLLFKRTGPNRPHQTKINLKEEESWAENRTALHPGVELRAAGSPGSLAAAAPAGPSSSRLALIGCFQ